MNRLNPIKESCNRKNLAWVLADPLGRIKEVGPAFSAICGFSPEEAIGRKPKDMLHGVATEPDKVEMLSSYLWNRLPVSTQITNYRKSGEPYRVHLTILPIILAGERFPHFFGITYELQPDEHTPRWLREFVFSVTEKVFTRTVDDAPARAASLLI